MTRWDSNTHINDPSCSSAPGCLALTQHVSTNTFLSKQTHIHMIYLALRLRTQQQVGRPIFVLQLSHQRTKIVFYQNAKVDLKKSSQNTSEKGWKSFGVLGSYLDVFRDCSKLCLWITFSSAQETILGARDLTKVNPM